MKWLTRGALIRLGVLAVAAGIFLTVCYVMMIHMPGKSFSGTPTKPPDAALLARLEGHVAMLGGEIGPRSLQTRAGLDAAEAYIRSQLERLGYTVTAQDVKVGPEVCHNLEAELRGDERPDEIVVIGAHYDSVYENACPGANDNGSGVAALIELARIFADTPLPRTLRFVAYVNEEPPYFQTGAMGSHVHAAACRERGDDIVAMLSVETIGYFTDEPGSQNYPPPFGLLYPSTGNFIAFVGNVDSRRLVREAVRVFREHAELPSEGAALPGWIAGVGWSDHWSYWEHGYPALMVTDTAPFRYEHYHKGSDTPDKLDYAGMTRVVEGLVHVVRGLGTMPERFGEKPTDAGER